MSTLIVAIGLSLRYPRIRKRFYANFFARSTTSSIEPTM